jgi:hypothetical protein
MDRLMLTFRIFSVSVLRVDDKVFDESEGRVGAANSRSDGGSELLVTIVAKGNTSVT